MFSKWFKAKQTAPGVPLQNEFFAPAETAEEAPVQSPCNGVCDMDWQNNICVGCFRTPGEIGSWRHMTNAEKRTCVASAAKRAESWA